MPKIDTDKIIDTSSAGDAFVGEWRNIFDSKLFFNRLIFKWLNFKKKI